MSTEHAIDEEITEKKLHEIPFDSDNEEASEQMKVAQIFQNSEDKAKPLQECRSPLTLKVPVTTCEPPQSSPMQNQHFAALEFLHSAMTTEDPILPQTNVDDDPNNEFIEEVKSEEEALEQTPSPTIAYEDLETTQTKNF